MAKRDKDYENRMAGYIAAYNIAKTEGIEALEKELRMRNVLKVDVGVSGRKMKECFKEAALGVYCNIITGAAWTLHEHYGFGKKRILEFKEWFDRTIQDTLDLDYLGEHYVRLEDFALELNEKYDLGIDCIRLAACEEIGDEKKPNYRMCKIDRVLEELRRAGFEEAAGFLEKKLY